jgi:SAM-dependent methyltransferase
MPPGTSESRTELGDTPLVEDLQTPPEFMHGHRKKMLFFRDCLIRYALERDVARAEVAVLDVGCGNGRVVSLPIAAAGFEVTGIDVHAPSIESARAANRLPNARFECMDFSALRSRAQYDAVILSDVLEHVDNPRALLDTALANLAKDGILLISIPNGYGPYEAEQYLIRIGLLKPVLALTRAIVHGSMRLKRRLQHQPWPPLSEPDRPFYNAECGHAHYFTLGRFRSLLSERDLKIYRSQNGAWFGGDLTYFGFYFVPRLVPLSLRVADYLPARLVSTWQVACRRHATG